MLGWIRKWSYVMAFGIVVIVIILVTIIDFVIYGTEAQDIQSHLSIQPVEALARISFGVLVNVLTAALIFILYAFFRDGLFAEEQEEKQQEIFREIGESVEKATRKINENRAIDYFSESYHTIDWSRILDGATRLDIAAIFFGRKSGSKETRAI